MRTVYHTRYQSPVGPLHLCTTDRGLAILEFERTYLKTHRRDDETWTDSPDRNAHAISQLDEYFAGRRREFTIPLDLRGTDFQLRCWRALLEIPYGQAISYAELARRVGSPRGFRAVGMANHDNPVAIIVPCHRVIASDGTLGGYGGGLELKRSLLELEGVFPRTLSLLPA